MSQWNLNPWKMSLAEKIKIISLMESFQLWGSISWWWHYLSRTIAWGAFHISIIVFMEQNATFSIRDKCFVFYWIEPTWINSFASFYLFWGIVVASNGGSALELATLTVPWSRKSSGSTLVHNIKNLLKLQNHKITKYCYKVSPFKSVQSEFRVMWLWNH